MKFTKPALDLPGQLKRLAGYPLRGFYRGFLHVGPIFGHF